MPTDTDIKSNFIVKEGDTNVTLDFNGGNATYEQISGNEVKVTVTGLNNNTIIETTLGQATHTNNASNVFNIASDGLFTGSAPGYYAVMQTQGYETYSNPTDDQFSVVRVEANASNTGWVSSDNQADLGSLNQISSEVIGSILRDSNGDYIHTQIKLHGTHIMN